MKTDDRSQKKIRHGNYYCQYCGHEQDELYGSYLCPVCRHSLIPRKKKAIPFYKKPAIMGPIFAVLLILLLCNLLLKENPVQFQQTINTISSLRKNAAKADAREVDSTSTLHLSDVKTDLVESQLDGKRYLIVTGEVSSDFLSFDIKISLYLKQDGLVCYQESDTVSALSPLNKHSFEFRVDLSELEKEGKVQAGKTISSEVRAQGKRLG